MNTKWYISTLFLLFSLFGAFHEQVSIPNQEIVLEFIDTTINKESIDHTIADVKEKLLTVGVSKVTIKETQNGTLKISYYSAIAVDDIKKVLGKDQEFVLNQNSENKEEDETASEYNIDIYELTNETDVSNTSDDKFVFEIKYHSDRFTTNSFPAFLKNVEENKSNQLFKTAYKAYKNNPFTEDKTSYKEPEVRAGPLHFIR